MTSRSPACVACQPGKRTHDLVDVIDDALNHDGRIAILCFFEQFCQSRLALINAFFRRRLPLKLDYVFGESEQFL